MLLGSQNGGVLRGGGLCESTAGIELRVCTLVEQNCVLISLNC